MNKRSPFSYVARIERVQKWITDNPGVHVNDMLDEMSDTPRGTLSSLLSHMFSAGHLLRPSKGFYTLPELVASPRSVAYDIKKLKKSPNIFRTIKNRSAKPKELYSEIPLNASEPNEIHAAIELLKSNGYKILKPTTEFKEI
jgi:hypothetical protein